MVTVRFLGVHLDSALNWDCHMIVFLGGLGELCMCYVALLIVFSLVLCEQHIMHYSITNAVLVWGHAAQSVFGVRRKAVRTLAGLSFRKDC